MSGSAVGEPGVSGAADADVVADVELPTFKAAASTLTTVMWLLTVVLVALAVGGLGWWVGGGLFH